MIGNQIKNLSTDEITKYLKDRDLQLMRDWYNGTNSNKSYNVEGEEPTRDIIYLCAYGICAYNKLSVANPESKEFLEYVIDNLEMFLEHGNVPPEMQEYYIDVLNRGNIRFLNEFLENYSRDEGNNMTNSRGAYTKSTPIGRALSEKDNAAYVSILMLPALLALIYITTVVVYFMFIK